MQSRNFMNHSTRSIIIAIIDAAVWDISSAKIFNPPKKNQGGLNAYTDKCVDSDIPQSGFLSAEEFTTARTHTHTQIARV